MRGALTVAGSDSGGGAGIQADLKTFAAMGVHGVCALTCVTAQNPGAVTAIQAVRPMVLRRQLEAVGELRPAAAKTGMLYSAALIREVARFFRGLPRLPLVIDPVMVATSGSRLLQESAVSAIRKELLPLAALITPNLDEAEILTGIRVREPEDLRRCARLLRDRYGCAVLVKGGHLEGPQAVDLFWDGREELLLEAPRVRGVSSHGTGCTYSAAIAGQLALGAGLPEAVVTAKGYITAAIAGARRAGRHWVLAHDAVTGRECRA